MKKTILLGDNGLVSTKTSAWLFGILGIIWCALGARELFVDGLNIGSSGYLIIGFLFIFYSVIVFTANPFAPQLTISDLEIIIRKNVFGSSTKYIWANIQSIELDKYLITFYLTDRIEEFSYSTNNEKSIEIKSAIREAAEAKNIQVTGS